MRVRLRFAKTGKVRFTSHRDVARLWERALRRAGLPVASTEGFSPRPKVHFGLALSTGHESLGEYLDVDFREDVDVDGLPELLSPLLPIGLDVEVASVIDRAMPSLQEAVTSCSWHFELLDIDHETAALAVKSVLDASTLAVTRERKGKVVEDDIRPAILDLAIVEAIDPADDNHADGFRAPVVIGAELATQPRGVRPAEFLEVLTAHAVLPLEAGRVCRTHQWIVLDGARREPLPSGAERRALHAEARAS